MRRPPLGVVLWLGFLLLVAGCGGESLCKAVVGPQAHEAQARLSVDGRSRLARFTAVVAPALEDRGRVPLPTMVRGAWLALGGPACVAEPIDLDAAQRVFALLAEHFAGADVADWPAFAAALADRVGSNDHPSRTIPSACSSRSRATFVMPSLASTPVGASAAHSPMATNDRAPARVAHNATGSNDATL